MAERTITTVSHRQHPARVFAVAVGLALIVTGGLGFIASSSFDTSPVERGTFLFWDTNGWLNVIHIVLGLMLLRGGLRHWKAARTACLNLGMLFLLLALVGFIDSSDVVNWFPVNWGTNAVHLVVGLAAFAVAFAPAPAPDPLPHAPTGRGTATGPSGLARADAIARRG